LGEGGSTGLGDELVAFFVELSPEARQEYGTLAELDRRFGEDVVAERSARATENR
jgi:hypothetical protein